MKIQLLRNPPRHLGCKLVEGQSGDVADKIGEELIRLGVAVSRTPDAEVKSEAKAEVKPRRRRQPVLAVPQEPTLSNANVITGETTSERETGGQ